MGLLKKLREKIAINKDVDINNCSNKELAEKIFSEKLMFVDKLTTHMLDTEGVYYYNAEEDKVEKENESALLFLTGSKDFSTSLAKSMKFVRTKALYEAFGMGRVPQQKIEKAYNYVEDILVYATLKFYSEKGVIVSWDGENFIYDGDLPNIAKELIEVVNIVRTFNLNLQYADLLGSRVNPFMVSEKLKFNEILEISSEDIFVF